MWFPSSLTYVPFRPQFAIGTGVMVEHRYGGPSTNIKTEVLRSYLGFFTTALKNRGFELWYIDGFAGTGSRTVAGRQADLFGTAPSPKKSMAPQKSR